jgi:FAD:protein FMN transferase
MMAAAEWRDWSCTVRVVAAERSLDSAVGAVRSTMAEIEPAASRFRHDSELRWLNSRAGRLTPVSETLAALLDVALKAAQRTGGAVDPTIGADLVAAGYDADIAVVRGRPAPEPRTPGVRPHHARRHVGLDRTLNLVSVPPGVLLDLGATAKAYAADIAAARAHQATGSAVLVEIGGDIAVSGEPEHAFVVNVAEHEGGYGELVELRRGGLATSTTTVRNWIGHNGHAHHIIDPATGRPARVVWRTATVWANSAVEANTASTAAIVLGAAAEDWLLANAPAARLVSEDGVVTSLPGWPVEVLPAVVAQ